MRKILKIPQATKKGYVEVIEGGVFDMKYPWSKTRRGRVQGEHGEISPTIICSTEVCLFEKSIYMENEQNFRIRKLTPRECFRLMDVDEKNIDKIQSAGISNSQQYKMAGNSIVVGVLENIFEQIFYPEEETLVLTP